MSIVLQGSTSGSITLQEPAIAGSNTISLPAATGTAVLTGVSGTVDINAAGSNNVTLSTNSTERVRVDSSGNVGIGTSSPDGRLHVMTSSAGSVTADADADDLTVESASNPGISILGSGDDVCSIYFGNPGTNGQKDGGVRYYQESFATVADRRAMTFITATSERMRITSAGLLLIGTTSGTPNPGFSFDPAGTLSIGNNAAATGFEFQTYRRSGVQIGSVYQNGTTAVLYNTTSDYRLKENIAPMTGALATVAQLKPCTYTWKVDGSAGQGFIAHELQAVVPDCVAGEKDAIETYIDEEGNEQTRIKPQGIDTSFLVATLTAAIQEQQAQIEELKAKVTALENNNG